MAGIGQPYETNKLYKILNSSGIPFRYHHFDSPPPVPYGSYLFTGADTVHADGITVAYFDNIRLELYTDRKSPETESQLENTLTAAGIAFEKIDEIYIETEKLFEVIYEI